MLFSSSLAFLTLAPLFLCVPTVLATSGFSSTCANYYLGNGVSDGTGELFIEAWCHGGLMYDGTPYSGKCSRLSLAECFKSDDGELEPLDQDTDLYHRDIATGCDIESCAIRGDAWDGPIMTCYCQGSSGQWTLASIDLDEHVGNEAGYLMCGDTLGTESCLDPWARGAEGELR